MILRQVWLAGALLFVPSLAVRAQSPPAHAEAAVSDQASASAAVNPTAGDPPAPGGASSEPVQATAAPAEERRTAPVTSSPSQTRPAAGTTADLIWFPTADGRLVPVPRDATLNEFLQWKAARQQPAESRDYSLSAVAIEGRAGEASAELEATIHIEIERDDVAVRVPLALTEAHLVSHEHDGPGSARFDGFERNEGYGWSFHGKGRHTLTLGLLVDIQQQAIPTRRISLSAPQAAVSYLKLRVPAPAERLTVLPSPGASIRKTPLGEAETEIAIFARERINLSWQLLPDLKPVETVLQAETTIRVEITGESVLLNPVTQRIRALGGSFDSFSVWLPRGFEVLEVLSGEQVLTTEPDPHQPGRTMVRLPAPAAGPVELRWRLRAPFPGDGRVLLDGFRVDRALNERGEIAIHAAEGYRVSRRGGEAVHRTNVNPSAGNGRPLTAYSFWKQPFSLSLDVQQVPSYLTADPYYFVLLRERRAQLVGDLWFDVHEGAVDQVLLTWPGLEQQGWTVQAEPPGLVERTPQFDPATGNVRIQLVKPQSRGFRVTVRAERDVTPGGEPFEFELPGIATSSLARPVVVVANAHNVESKLLPADQTTIRPLGAALRDKAAQLMLETDLPDDYLDLRRSEFRAESEQLRFSAAVTVHSQEVETENVATLTLRQDRLEVLQEITYDVAYEPLSQIRLSIPDTPERTADEAGGRFDVIEELEDGSFVVLRPNWSGLEGSTARLARCSLTQPRIGTFRVIVSYERAAPADLLKRRPAVLRLPVAAAEGQRGPLRVRLESNGLVQMRIDDPQWSRQLSPDGDARHIVEWTTDEPASAIPLTFAPPQPEGSGEYVLPRARIVTALLPDGTLWCAAQFRFEGAPAVVPVDVPESGAETARFWWGRRWLPPAEATAPATGRRRFLLTIPADERGGSRLLTVEYEAPYGASFALLEQQHLVAPRVPGVWVEQTLWEVVIPDKQHLFAEPAGFVPRYAWIRDGVVWTRTTPAGRPRPEDWIGASAGPDFSRSIGGGHAYEFAKSGAAGEMRFRTMSSAALIASGAGFAWAVGFVLLTVAAARHVLTVLSLVLAVAIAATFFPTAVAVLVQPVLLGLLLAVAAAVIDGLLRRKRIATVLTFSSPSDYAVTAPSGSSIEPPRSALVGSNDATAMRSASSYGALESLAAPESGSRT